ncbi:hypothetical protein Dtox_0746 [Desulfofarcimen acetoxidans DSM 771]|uniref:Transporter suffix domain-containing protein n=1 Tax=Desulfofarcimen acetoxidans (strain ATCC 49208 / DSM 771 / KCTC 5769 / VKM B-1644 / 5575) TaxID=485916 RepID=C8W1L1_DESAS|nr:transporter suffix domain-containing protein [Desulfofarcimen acetoxidans]ACV61656.1 hypothetical protein Dtox_0746 [Desulfofarcimen acetoxidans DSM 771]
MIHQKNRNNQISNKKHSVELRKSGIGLVVLSFILYGLILLIPFVSFSTGIKVTISTVLVVLGEISFWVGGIILGKEVISRYKKFLNPINWFKRDN